VGIGAWHSIALEVKMKANTFYRARKLSASSVAQYKTESTMLGAYHSVPISR